MEPSQVCSPACQSAHKNPGSAPPPPEVLASVPPRARLSIVSDNASGHTTDEPNDSPTEDNSYRGLP
ncbi:hypothetical protein BHE90_012196, partial [Fusarium euwallaceae]